MKVYISYFYHVRHLPENVVPFSTAMSDPEWFHEKQGNSHVFTDKRGIINGLRLKELSPYKVSPSSICSRTCTRNYRTCAFLREYTIQLFGTDFQALMAKIRQMLTDVGKPDADICLLVYEKPDNPCSERGPIRKWFAANNIEIIEFEGENENGNV